MALTLSSTAYELRNQVGPWQRSTLYRIARAFHLAGLAPSDDAAHELVWNLLEAAEPHTPAVDALLAAGVEPADLAAVEYLFGELEHQELERRDHELREHVRVTG
jgi:hypothetical protein